MLKAYSFTENEGLSQRLNDKSFFSLERQLAAEFVRQHHISLSAAKNEKCPLCGSDETDLFTAIDTIPFFRCDRCWSIFAPAEQSIVDEYRAYTPITALRSSDEYQEIASVKRLKMWDELVFWFKFRSARYFGKSANFSILDIGNRYNVFREMIKSFSSEYTAVSDLVQANTEAEIVLFLTQIQYETNPIQAFEKIYSLIKPNGLLFLSARVGSGFDVLTLKGATDTIYPFEHTTLPSIKGLQISLEKTGFELLEITSPGNLDIRYVMENIEKLPDDNLFLKYLSKNSDESILTEFQRFIQKSNLSSHARLVARKKGDTV
ncbi:MAG: hypothetical protein LBS62_05285 [Clostridiales bacterium]|nr:hypothetical protein [Clostridiales bacterium]